MSSVWPEAEAASSTKRLSDIRLGPRLYGTMGPGELWGVIVAVWAAQLIWSPIWLSRFEMGPLEWVWRRLTYGRPVAFRRVQVVG